MMTFRDLQWEQARWCARNFPNSTPMQPFMGLVEEVGELSHCLLKREQGIRGTYEEHTESLKDAVGDILIYLVDLCTKNGLDIQECIETTWNDVSKRDWIAHPGNGIDK
jgi:NTP pyrophosphatase (non-canonical NTP hydrolase)